MLSEQESLKLDSGVTVFVATDKLISPCVFVAEAAGLSIFDDTEAPVFLSREMLSSLRRALDEVDRLDEADRANDARKEG